MGSPAPQTPVTHFTCQRDHEFAVRGEEATGELVLIRPRFRAAFVEMIDGSGATTRRALFHLLDGQGTNHHTVAVGFTSAAAHASRSTPEAIERDLPLVGREWVHHRLMAADPNDRPDLPEFPATAFWDIDSQSDFFDRLKARSAPGAGVGSPQDALAESIARASNMHLWGLGPHT
jgi:hypothetical protein